MIAIPGTTKAANAQANFDGLKVSLSKEEASVLEELGAQVAGDRGNEASLGASKSLRAMWHVRYAKLGLEGNMKKAAA